MAGTDGRRVIYADSGVMGFTEVGTDLQLKLFDGSVHAFRQSDPSLMQITDFTTNTIRVRDVSNRLDLEANDGVRGDREMPTGEMMEVGGGARYAVRLAEARRRVSADRDLRALLVLPQTGGPARADRPPPRRH